MGVSALLGPGGGEYRWVQAGYHDTGVQEYIIHNSGVQTGYHDTLNGGVRRVEARHAFVYYMLAGSPTFDCVAGSHTCVCEQKTSPLSLCSLSAKRGNVSFFVRSCHVIGSCQS